MDFYERAAKLGHSRSRLDAGETIRSTVTIPTIDALKEFLDEGRSPEGRKTLAEDLFGNLEVKDPKTDGTAKGILTRVQRFLYGNDPLDEADRRRTQSVFPMKVDAISAANATINTPQNLGTGGTMAYVNYGTLTLESGGYFILYNKPLTFNVDTLIRNGGGTDEFYDINIYGATGSTGNTGGTGGVGGVGSGGGRGTCASPGVAGNSGGPGGTGGTGSVGYTGDVGGAGMASEVAMITITTSIEGSAPLLTVATRSGTGGVGGVGGRGGTGGTGGKGGDGESCGCEGTNGGNGGVGGRGGTGGAGGTGGNGVNANANISVTVPAGQLSNVQKFSWPAPPGSGGNPGGGGPGGGGGNGGGEGGSGSCPKHGGGSGGGSGGQGNPGSHGNGGTVEGNPAEIIVRQS